MQLPRTFLLAAAAAVAAGHASAQRILTNAYGNQLNARFGAALDRIGDVTGDGSPDLVVGSPNQSPNPLLPAVGAIALVNGRTGAFVYQLGLNLPAYSHLGTTTIGTADLNGDGWPDFVAGAPFTPGSPTTPNVGLVSAFEGRTGAPLWTSSAVGSNLRLFGSALARIGDVTGDGTPDLVVGYPGAFSQTGALLMNGRTGAWGNSLAAGTASSESGVAIATLSDQNGDGRPEIVVGEPRFNFNGNSGRLRVIDPSMPFTASYQLFQNYGYDVGAGQRLANAGDIDHDGLDDFLMVYRGSQSQGPWSPRVVIYSGGNGNVIDTIWRSYTDASFGAAIAGIGDFDGDGAPDIAVGAPDDNNGAGRVDVYSGASRALITSFTGDAGSHFGSALAPFGDVDGDGRTEFAIGAPDHVYNGVPVGRVCVASISIPGYVMAYGTGCAGQTGAPALSRYTPFGLALPPVPGSTVTFQGTNLTAAAASLWIYGFSNSVGPTGPLPMDLAVLGAPGCNLLVSPDVMQSYGGGNRLVPLSIPGAMQLVGAQVFVQIAGLGGGYANGLATSNGLALRIGNF